MHRDSIDMMVTAAIVCAPTETRAEGLFQLLAGADRLGQQLRDENAAAVAEDLDMPVPAAGYEWRPVADLLTPTVDDDFVLQLERTRVAFIEACCAHSGWSRSPARRYTDHLGRAIRNRLERHTTDPYRMILTSSELASTDADWRRPTLYAHAHLTEPTPEPTPTPDNDQTG